MKLFNRFWELNIKSNPETQTAFDYVIKQDDFGNSLRVKFDINATIDIRYYSGTIRVYNLEPDKRRNLVFNILGEKFGTGPSIKLVAGYQEKPGVIMDGVVQRGHTVREPSTGDWITVLQCGTSFKNDRDVTIQSAKVTNGNLLTLVNNWLSILIPEGATVDTNGRFIVKRAKSFSNNLTDAVNTFLSTNTIDKTVSFSGPASKILNEISLAFDLVFYYDNEGFNVTVPVLGQEDEELEISQDTGMIGSPVYTDTGAKVITYLKPEFRLFQPIRVKSDVLDKKVKILKLNHRGDSHSNEWYSEIDASNIGQALR